MAVALFLPSMHRNPLLPAVCVSLFIIALAGCAKRETPVESALRNQTLHLALAAEPRDLDPQIATSMEDFALCNALMEGLTTLDPATSRPIPGAAERWEMSSDGRTWTFHLRPNARWSNGDVVKAADFVYGFRRALSASLGAEYAPQLYHLRGAEAFHTGKSTDFSTVGARAVDDRTLELTLKAPVPYLLALTALPAWFPAHRPTIEKFDALARRGTPWTRPENYVGNGAFTLAEWRTNQHLRVVRSQNYWDRDRVRLQAAMFYPVENAITQEAMFRTGQLHLTEEKLPVEKIRAYREDRSRAPLLQQGALLATKFFRFNCGRAPLSDVRVRRALALAVDREKLARNVMQSDLAAFSFTPPDCAGYTADRSATTDLAEAKRLLAAAGFPEGRGFPRVDILFYPSSSSGRPVAEAVQQMWRSALGIDVGILQQETKTVLDARRAMTYDILLSDWFGDYIDPLTFLDLWTTSSEHNRTGWSSTAYDELLGQAATVLDQAARYAVLRRAEALVLAEAPITPLFYQSSNQLRHPSVKGWHTNLVSTHPLKFVWLEAPK